MEELDLLEQCTPFQKFLLYFIWILNLITIFLCSKVLHFARKEKKRRKEAARKQALAKSRKTVRKYPAQIPGIPPFYYNLEKPLENSVVLKRMDIRSAAKSLKGMDVDLKDIAHATGLSIEEIEKL